MQKAPSVLLALGAHRSRVGAGVLIIHHVVETLLELDAVVDDLVEVLDHDRGPDVVLEGLLEEDVQGQEAQEIQNEKLPA